ncbi:MAG: hypothetical protein LAO21_06220 [Acidobacteriia bacterium]|nr:hypothetical protein [Terriglobia bacterium]
MQRVLIRGRYHYRKFYNVSLHGRHINLFIEQGPALGPVLEVTVKSVDEAKARLVKKGCKIIKDEPDFLDALSKIRSAWFII